MPHCVLCKIQMPRRRAAALPRSRISYFILIGSPIFLFNVLVSEKILLPLHSELKFLWKRADKFSSPRKVWNTIESRCEGYLLMSWDVGTGSIR